MNKVEYELGELIISSEDLWKMVRGQTKESAFKCKHTLMSLHCMSQNGDVLLTTSGLYKLKAVNISEDY